MADKKPVQNGNEEPKRDYIKEAQDAIYTNFEDQVDKGNLGTYAKQHLDQQRQKKKRYFDE